MEKHEDVTSILSKLNLDHIEKTIKPEQEDHEEKPLGIFKAYMIKQLRHIHSDRELYRRLWNDEALREICDIEEKEKPYHPSQLTRFRNKVGTERLTNIMNSLLEELVEGGIIKGKTIALDAPSSRHGASVTRRMTATGTRIMRAAWEEMEKPMI